MGTLNLDEYKPALEAYFAALDDVVLAYLFGSYARGQAGPLSDVDVAVLLNDPIVGIVSDRVHTRWGRRRPWFLWG